MFKIAITAGHYKYTAGKRCLKSLDPNETREWVLNARIAEKVEKLLKDYEGYELLRTDDPAGEKPISVADRVSAANLFGADVYISVHHNAGIKGGTGGGIVAYIHPLAPQKTVDWQKALYDSLIKHTGLKGNRASPLAKSNLQECRDTAMPAVLLELGFMDSAVDVPVILTEEYADKCAAAILEVLVQRGGLTKKKPTQVSVKTEKETSVQESKPTSSQMGEEELVKNNAGLIVNFLQFFIGLIKKLWGKTDE